MMDQLRFQKQIDFILKIDEEKNILRQTHLSNQGRRENDAEHAWHMAIMAYLLKEYSNAEIDIAKVMLMCLIHDIVEIEAGDTYAYDEAGKATEKAREELAAEHLFGMLPDDQKAELKGLFEEFERCESAEAKFAKVMDNFQPLLLNHSNNGEDWKQHEVRREQVVKRQEKSKTGSDVIYEKTMEMIEQNVHKGNLIP